MKWLMESTARHAFGTTTPSREMAPTARPLLPVVLAALLAVAAHACPANAGAWTQSSGGYYGEFETSYVRAGHERNHEGERLPIFAERLNFTDATYEEVNARLYGEFGVRPNLTLIGKLYAKYAEERRTELGGVYFDSFRNNTWSFGLGDATAGMRVGVLREPLVLSIQTQLKVPLGYDASPENSTPPLGNGEVDGDASLQVGKSFGLLYVTGTGGYRVRGGVFHDEWLFEAEAGSELQNWFLQAKLEGVRNTVEPRDLAGATIELPLAGGGGAYPIVVGDQNWVKLRVAVARRLAGSWLKLTLVDLVAGQNTIDGTEIALGLYVKR